MASQKKRRKQHKHDQARHFGGTKPTTAKDGDRGRRGGPSVREALAIKRALRGEGFEDLL